MKPDPFDLHVTRVANGFQEAKVLFAVNMLTGTRRGRTYTADEVSEWMREAGLEPGSVESIEPRTQMIVGERFT